MAVPATLMTLEEFLAWENEQPDRNEFHRGEVFAMVGARRAHGRVVSNLTRHFGNLLDGTPCQVFAEGMKVQIGTDTILYPDIFVTFDKADLATEMIFRAPTLVLEVLSPTTQAYDRSQKFALYRRVESLQEFVLVDPDTRRIEVFRRGADGLWDLHDQSDDESLVAASIGCTVRMIDVFAGIDAA